MIKDKIGNTELLNLNKTAFLCSRKIEAAAVLKSLDWATDMRDRGECIISGFHSKIEKDVFRFLARGTQPIILVLARGLKKRWEPEIKTLLDSRRLLIITPHSEKITRASAVTAASRNKLMLELADKIVIGYVAPGGNFQKFLSKFEGKEIEYLSQKTGDK